MTLPQGHNHYFSKVFFSSNNTLQEVQALIKMFETSCERVQTDLDRQKNAIESLIKYVEEHQDKDLLITGFNETSQKNPYKRERVNKCAVM